MKRTRLTRLLPFLGASLLAMIVGLAGLLAFVQVASSRLVAEEHAIVEDTGPSMLHLSRAVVSLAELEMLLEDWVHGTNPPTADAIAGKKAVLDGSIERYYALPIDPGEDVIRADIERSRAPFDRAYARIVSSPPKPARALQADLHEELDGASVQVETALLRAGTFNAEQAKRSTRILASVRHMLLPGAIVLEIACIVAAAIALAAAYRVVRIANVASELARDALETRASELDAFSARVAHDMLAPLQGVSLALALAERRLDAQADAREHRGVVRAQGTLDRVRQMCTDLLEFARAGVEHGEAACVPAVVVAGVLDDLAPIADQAHVQVAFSPGTSRRVRSSPGLLASMMSNLVRNAIEHGAGSETSRVLVRVDDAGPDVRFEVEDSGPGVPPEEQDSVFEPFVRGKGARVAGLGLGLATVRRLAEANGGRVGLSSEPTRKGASFWFTLPAL